MDMATGRGLTGSIECALLAAAGVQLARECYHIPVNMHGQAQHTAVWGLIGGGGLARRSLSPIKPPSAVVSSAFARPAIGCILEGERSRFREGNWWIVDGQSFRFSSKVKRYGPQ
jgi:hypothetical protein